LKQQVITFLKDNYMEKVNFSGFLKVKAFIGYEHDGKKGHQIESVRLNPMHISAYWPSTMEDNDKNLHSITKIDSGHYTWFVDIPFEEFDLFFCNEVERGFNIKTDNQ